MKLRLDKIYCNRFRFSHIFLSSPSTSVCVLCIYVCNAVFNIFMSCLFETNQFKQNAVQNKFSLVFGNRTNEIVPELRHERYRIACRSIGNRQNSNQFCEYLLNDLHILIVYFRQLNTQSMNQTQQDSKSQLIDQMVTFNK